MADNLEAVTRTHQAISALRDGNVADARTILAEAITLDPDYEYAWLWFASATQDKGEQKFCLRRANKISHSAETAKALTGLRGVTATEPPELSQYLDPPAPDIFTDEIEQARAIRRRRLFRRSLLVLGLAALAVAGLYWWGQRGQAPAYVAVVANSPAQDSEIAQAAQTAANDLRETGAAGPHPIEVVTFNDDGDPERARQIAEEIASNGKFVAVIGHENSVTSAAAAPIYQRAQIPMITPSATADSVADNNDYVFRTVFDNRTESEGMAVYANTVLGAKTATVVLADNEYGRSLASGFKTAFSRVGTVSAEHTLSPQGGEDEVDALAKEIAEAPPTDVLVLATFEDQGVELVRALASRNVRPTIVGGDAVANDSFAQQVAVGGSTVDLSRIYAATPAALNAVSGEAARILLDYVRSGAADEISWKTLLTHDAVYALNQVITAGDLPVNSSSIAATRTGIRDGLDGARSPETSLRLPTGRLYFEDTGSASRSVEFLQAGTVDDSLPRMSAAYTQLRPYSTEQGVDLTQAVKAGQAVVFAGTPYTLLRAVRYGVNVNSVSELDPALGTFNADFFLWLKYTGGASAADVIFPNAVDPKLSVGDPIRSSVTDGVAYQLYRVNGDFKTSLDFREFPFDEQRLPITVQNRSLPTGRVVYAVDPDVTVQPQQERLRSGLNDSLSVLEVPNWRADSLIFFQSSIGNTSVLGDPSIEAGLGGVTYSQAATQLQISRDVRSFLVKNVLPLALLGIVLYITLWMPYSDATSRISFGVTGILTGAVMLNSVTSSLPTVSYTVAIEWAYYFFIALAAATIIVTLVGRRWEDARRLADVRVLSIAARTVYPLLVAGVVAMYAIRFG